MGPDWRWATIWMAVKEDFFTWMVVRWYMDGGEPRFFGHGCRWCRTWMEVKHIMRPGWVSDWTWMDTRCSFLDPHEGETWPEWMWDVNLTPGLHNLVPPPSRWHIASIKVPKLHLSSILFPSQCHPGLIPSKSYLTRIWVLVSTLYTYHLISIKVPRLSSLLHPCHVSPAS